ncbi:MAG TPA: HDIG domain-containing protein [Dehalococcoidia bacterium]|nr:HDIG domain-containing protein [Dehalococcoidia bacterium]
MALALVGVLFPWFPGETVLEVGSVAQRSVAAPRDRTYDSRVLTEAASEQRAASVGDVLVHDPGIAGAQLVELERQIEAIAEIRDDANLSASARESAVRAVPGVALSVRAAAALTSVPDHQWDEIVDDLRDALERTLAVAIDADDVASARQRVRELLTPLLSSDQALALGELADPLVVATQVIDAERTAEQREKARASQPSVRVTVDRGETIVRDGDVLTAADIEQLDELGLRQSGLKLSTLAATVLVAAMAGAAAGGYLIVAQPAAVGSLRRLMLFGLLILIPATGAKFGFTLLLPDVDRHFLAYAVPLAAAPIAAAVLLDVMTALVVTVVLASVASFVTLYLPEVGLVPGGELEAARMWLAVIAGSFAGISIAASADRLQRYLAAGFASAVAVAGALLLFWLLDADRSAVELIWVGGVAVVGGVLSALISVGAFVLLSRPFGIITRVELMELAQLNHRLLRRLQDEAPGTFQHSILVGNLAERAADRIGADALLVRIGAYYHDVGKLVGPEFFYENIGDSENPHESLDPLQSTRVIHQHVTAGVDLARREGLPEAVVRFIPQHHGTRLMAYFYRRAAEVDSEIDPELFRYGGPKPQSRETAIVMLADASEASVRADTNHTAEHITEVIEGIVRERVEEGQFDECALSLRDLRMVVDSFSSALNAVYHPRVEYPEPTDRELAERAGAAAATADDDDEFDAEGRRIAEAPPLATSDATLPETTAAAAGVPPDEPAEDDA